MECCMGSFKEDFEIKSKKIKLCVLRKYDEL